jgi:5-methylcytosine-specific restriction endonuclease McrA
MPKGIHLPRRIVICGTCGIEFSCEGSRTSAKYCSRKCMAVAQIAKPRPMQECCGCKTLFLPKRSTSRYCHRSCAKVVRKNLAQESGVFSNYKTAKAVLMSECAGCSECGWNKELGVLELHHIDRNTKNNHITNLKILCPNCHSVEHFKAKDGQFAGNLGRKAKRLAQV